MPGFVSNQIEAGLGEVETGNFNRAAEQGNDPQNRGDVLRTNHRLGSEGGIVSHHEAFQIEAGLRQQAQMHRRDLNRASNRQTDRFNNA